MVHIVRGDNRARGTNREARYAFLSSDPSQGQLRRQAGSLASSCGVQGLGAFPTEPLLEHASPGAIIANKGV